MAFKIFLSPPHLYGKERVYVDEAFTTNWIAPYGPLLDEFESLIANYLGLESGLALNSGTSGIHLILKYLGVGQGDIVFCSDLTFVGSCNPILYEGGEPVFIDCEPNTWNMSATALEKGFQWAEKNNKMPKVVIIVDLYGETANYDKLLRLCKGHGVPVIEDAAEALGASYKNKKCGSFGDFSIISFNGNKIVTTSGGGMVLSNNTLAIEKMRFWSTQAREHALHYEHREVGYNYRMSNVSAGIGIGQMEYLDEKIKRRIEINETYKKELVNYPIEIKEIAQKDSSNYWLSLLTLKDDKITPTDLITYLQNAEIEARPIWKPMHMQPLYKNCKSFSHDDKKYISKEIFNSGLCLPSGDGMTHFQQSQVIKEIKAFFRDLEKF